jgi:DNA-directed RNA polymerase specialized sigma24 family protein
MTSRGETSRTPKDQEEHPAAAGVPAGWHEAVRQDQEWAVHAWRQAMDGDKHWAWEVWRQALEGNEPWAEGQWLHGLQAERSWAYSCIDEQFTVRLVEEARQRLLGKAGCKVGPDEVVQSVYRSFFQRRGALALATTRNLWGLLLYRTRKKCQKKLRGLLTRKRRIDREVSLDALVEAGGTVAAPDPDEPALLTGNAEALLNTLADVLQALPPTYRAVMERVLRGQEDRQLLDELGCSDRAVRRAKQRFKELLLGGEPYPAEGVEA